jgi:hypothetical protein
MIHSQGVQPFKANSSLELKSTAAIDNRKCAGNDNEKRRREFHAIYVRRLEATRDQSLGSYALLADFPYRFVLSYQRYLRIMISLPRQVSCVEFSASG